MNFSQFADMPGGEKSNPFELGKTERKSDEHSGFSLSNFGNVGGDPFAQAGRSSNLNQTNDFFAGF